MNRDEIIRMARETDLVPSWMQHIPEHQLKWIEDFAAAVAAAERDRACRIVTGLCISDNNAHEINTAIRESKP